MSKYVWLFSAIGLIAIIIGVLIYSLTDDALNQTPNSLPKTNENEEENKNINNNNIPTGNIIQETPGSITGGISSGGGGGGGGSSGGGSSSPGNPAGQQNQTQEPIAAPSCNIVRPGNIPNVGCTVNHIKQNEISIKLDNGSGEDINVKISLENCVLQEGIVQNNNERDFIFPCSIQGSYYEGDITINYLVPGDSISTGGIVSGIVS